MDPQHSSPLEPPSIPPRPNSRKSSAARVASEATPGEGSPAPVTAGVPRIPPRPSRHKAPAATLEETHIDPKSPLAHPPESTAPSIDAATPTPSEVDAEPQLKATATIPSDMEVHAPIARLTGASLSGRPDFLRSISTGTSTPPRLPASKIVNDGGIPEIGKQVPMYPNAGDVQAPTPAPSRQTSALPTHPKKGPRSASPYKKEDFGEYGSSLHPLERRSGHYSLSSDDLNQIVAQTATPTTGTFSGVPEEELGYLASEEYAKHIGTATATAAGTPREELSESEAMKTSIADLNERPHSREGSRSPEVTIHVEPRAHQRSGSHPYGRHNLPAKFNHSQTSLVVGAIGEAHDINEEDEYGQRSGEFRDEHYNGTPILASDEITKRGGTTTPYHHAAVSPSLQPRRTISRPPSRPQSRGATREAPGAVDQLVALDAQVPFTPLEQVEEHEPLFPDGDETKDTHTTDTHTALREGVEKAFGGSTPSRASRKFPSNDIWEDAPPSSHLSATVASPPPGLSPLGLATATGATIGGELPDEESDRLGVPNRHKKTQSPDGQSKPTRPTFPKTSSGKQKFPSKDIWEEAPDSTQLTTTVSHTPAEAESQSPVEPPANLPFGTTNTRSTTGAPLDDSNVHVNPDGISTTNIPLEAKKPETPSRPSSPEKKEQWGPTGAVPLVPSARPASRVVDTPTKFDSQDQIELAQKPSFVPCTSASPESPTEKKTAPVVPDRPKPIIPQRPSRVPAKFQSQLSQPEEALSAKAPPPIKPKPAIGGKIAALKANLALEQKLAAGPLPFKRKEEEEKIEAAPQVSQPLVSDVMKGRAKGPRGRKLPTTAYASASASEAPTKGGKTEESSSSLPLSFMISRTVWSIEDENDARVVVKEVDEPKGGENIQEQELKGLSTENKEAQGSTKKVEFEIADSPVVDEKRLGGEHPEDAAPTYQSSLDQEKPAGIRVERAPNQAEAGQTADEEGDGDWDVVTKI